MSESENEENLGRGKRLKLKLSKPQFDASPDNVSDSEYLLPIGVDIIQYFEYIIFN